MNKPFVLRTAPETPETRRHRSLPPILGFEAYQVFAVAIVVLMMLPFWIPAILAFIVACGLQPALRMIEKKLHMGRGNGSILIVSSLCAAMVGMTGYTAVRVARLTVEFAAPAVTGASGSGGHADAAGSAGENKEKSTDAKAAASDDDAKKKEADSAANDSGKTPALSFAEMRQKVTAFTTKMAPSYRKDVDSFLNTLPKTVVAWLASHAQDFVSSTLDLLTQMAFFFLFLFLFMLKGKALFFSLLKKKRDSQSRIKLWYDIVETASFTSVISTAAIGLLQATIVTVACGFLGYNEWGLLFFGCFILSFVPVLGPASIPFVLALSAFVEGNNAPAIGLTVLSIFAGTIDNVIRPIVVSAENDINPVLSFIAMIGAIALMGFPGLFLGPFLVTVSALLLGDKMKEGFRPL